MAGTDPTRGFQLAEFERDIRAAMLMAMPQTVEMRPTFKYTDYRTFDLSDAEGSPLDWEAQRTVGVPPEADIQVLCAVESIGQGEASEGTDLGTFDMNRARLYLLHEEWEQVKWFTNVWISGSEYVRVKELPEFGLYDAIVHVVEIRARDEA